MIFEKYLKIMFNSVKQPTFYFLLWEVVAQDIQCIMYVTLKMSLSAFFTIFS